MTSTILIADDTPTVLDYLEFIFENSGFAVVRAASGEQVLEKAQEVKPDVFLIDVMMPGIDGVEVCRRLRQEPATARLPILLYSAVVGEEIRAKARAAGADEFLGKTIHHTELVTRVSDWLAARAMPGSIGDPLFIPVAVDLLRLLEVELVWILGLAGNMLHHLAVGCERGEVEAVRFIKTVGLGPFSANGRSAIGAVLRDRHPRFRCPLDELGRFEGGVKLAQAMKRLGGRTVTLVPVLGQQSPLGLIVFMPQQTLEPDRDVFRAVALATRYASAALTAWGRSLAQPPHAGPGASHALDPRRTP